MDNEATVDYILKELDKALLEGKEIVFIKVSGWVQFSIPEQWLIRKEGWEWAEDGKSGKFSPEEGINHVTTTFKFTFVGGVFNVGDEGFKTY